MEGAVDLQADIARMTKLKQLSDSGRIDGRSSYFNHLIDIYGNQARMRAGRTFTDRERERVDLFLKSFAAAAIPAG
jgi:hypothetical protein